MIKRSLGIGETYLKFCYENGNGTTGVVAAVQITGPLTAATVKEGLIALQKRHPLLRARFAAPDDKHDYFEVDHEPAGVPLETVSRMDDEYWKKVYDRHLNDPFAKKPGYLWHATFVDGGAGKDAAHEIIASFHHTIIDGMSLGYFFRDLLQYCASISQGVSPKIEPFSFLPNVEALEKRKISWPEYLVSSESSGKQIAAVADQLIPFERYIPLEKRRTKFILLEHSKEDLQRMITLCRRNSTSLTALLSAALLTAVYRVKNNGAAALKQVAMTPVDIRKRCDADLNGRIGCYVCAVTTVFNTGENTTLWELARNVRTTINQAIEEQVDASIEFDRNLDLQILNGIKTGPIERKFHLGAGVTNYGLLDLPLEYGPLRLKSFFSGASRHWGDWLMLLHTATVGEKLSSCFCYEEPLLSAESAANIVREFAAILKTATA